MNKNDIFEIEITGVTDEGSGVGRAEGMAVFVPYALPGEIVRVIIVKALKSYAFGKLMEVIRPSAHRVKAECEYFYKCGGCCYWNADYAEELRIKRQTVEDCIRRIAGLDTDVPPVLGAESRRGYRNKGQFPVNSEGIGIYAPNSHRVVDMDRCIIQDETNPAVIGCVRDWMRDFEVAPYDEETDSGTVRHIYTRTGGGRLMVCIVTRTAELPHADALVGALRGNVPNLSGVLQNVNDKKTNVVLGKRFRTLWGDDFLIDSIGDKKFKISPLSFYQVNGAQTKALYDKALEFADLSGRETVWDLYCGIGTIGQYAADKAARVIGVEIVADAVANAKENAKLNGLTNTEYYCGAAEKVAPVGALVELLGNGKEHFGRHTVVGLGEPDVTERIDETRLAALEQAADRTQRAQPFGAGQCTGRDHRILSMEADVPPPVVISCRPTNGVRGSSWPACAAANG